MDTVEGFASTCWAAGFGDYTMTPDLDTLGVTPRLDRTALVDHLTHADATRSP